MGRLFGTDGIRGTANKEPLIPETAVRVGKAIGISCRKNGSKHKRVLIGKDTRLSGYMIETAISSGLCSVGVDPYLVGPLPTPGIAFLTVNMRAAYGIVISASHNPYFDNGIKIFDLLGFKLTNSQENSIEDMVLNPITRFDTFNGDIGKAFRIDDAIGRYVVHVKDVFPKYLSLDGLKIVIDCANGAAYKVAPWVFEELGADVMLMNHEPSGLNINDNCGTVYPGQMAKKVKEVGAHLGIALDGDADRVILSDEKGDILFGDHILAICSIDGMREGTLRRNTAVTTVMSTLALDMLLSSNGIKLVRTQVGDKHVVEYMRNSNYNFGGEQSGHFIFLDHASSGDGILTSLKVLEVMVKKQRPLSELKRILTPNPQLLINIETNGMNANSITNHPKILKAVMLLEEKVGKPGRIFIRYSGTQPLIRLLIEGKDESILHEVGKELTDIVNRVKEGF